MSSKFYDEVAALDRAIADRWKRRAKDDPKRKLRPRDVEAILDPLMKPKGTITERQVEAISKLVLDATWTNEALAVIQVYIKVGVEAGLFQNGGDVMVTPDEFKPVTNALGTGMTGRIAFRSPGTNFSYVPGHYQAIQSLISASKIFVLEVRMHNMDTFARVPTLGQYRSDANHLYIFAGRPPAETAMTIVHEVTHAIQDWQDVSAKNKYIEADAYIAGAIADLAQGGKATAVQAGEIYTPAMEAAKLVVAGKANASDTVWTDAYKAIVKDVEKRDAYKKTNEDMFERSEKGEGTREKDQMDVIMAAIAKKTP
jgi:hypothetical protein